MRTAFYNGILYQIEYQKELSNNRYTQKHVYHIKTENINFHNAHTAIESIMDDKSWRAGYWKLQNRMYPSISNALHSYHTFDYNEELDVYVYTRIVPYDD